MEGGREGGREGERQKQREKKNSDFHRLKALLDVDWSPGKGPSIPAAGSRNRPEGVTEHKISEKVIQLHSPLVSLSHVV